MSCPTSTLQACDFAQFLVHQAPKFDELILEDITLVDNWIGNVSIGTKPMGTPAEITQDRFRGVWPNTTKVWRRVSPQGLGCVGNPCDPPEHQIGLGADRLTYYPEAQSWVSPLFCFDAMVHVTHAKQHLMQYVEDILRPATKAIGSMFLRKRALLWSSRRHTANANLTPFTFQWTVGGATGDEEMFLDTSVDPNNVFKLVPQMLQNRFSPLMRKGYAGKNPFKETGPFIELVTDMDTCWSLDKLGGQQGVGPANNPNVQGNWRFTEFSAANKYWRYGFSGQIGNYLTRVDELGLRFNYIGDLGGGVGPNRHRYQVVLPYRNEITTGAGGAAGLGRVENDDFDKAQFAMSFISHKRGMELQVQDMDPVHPEMPFVHRNLGGKWFFATNDLGADENGDPISNKRGNKGQFVADFEYWVRPLHTEFMEVFFHKREQFCIPEIDICSEDAGYPGGQDYNSEMPPCPIEGSDFEGAWNLGVPTGDEAGPLH
jgi:hypothetical protein